MSSRTSSTKKLHQIKVDEINHLTIRCWRTVGEQVPTMQQVCENPSASWCVNRTKKEKKATHREDDKVRGENHFRHWSSRARWHGQCMKRVKNKLFQKSFLIKEIRATSTSSCEENTTAAIIHKWTKRDGPDRLKIVGWAEWNCAAKKSTAAWMKSADRFGAQYCVCVPVGIIIRKGRQRKDGDDHGKILEKSLTKGKHRTLITQLEVKVSKINQVPFFKQKVLANYFYTFSSSFTDFLLLIFDLMRDFIPFSTTHVQKWQQGNRWQQWNPSIDCQREKKKLVFCTEFKYTTQPSLAIRRKSWL